MINHLSKIKSNGANKLAPEHHALFVPAISTFYVNTLSNYIYDNKPNRLENIYTDGPKSLNYLDKDNGLFYYPTTLYSAGHATLDLTKGKIKEGIISQRDKASSFIIGDSGGYQIASGVLNFDWTNAHSQPNIKLRQDILNWLEEYCDVSMTLDVPTRAIGNAKATNINSFEDCVEWTKYSLDYFEKHRTPGKTKFLNVLQGRNEYESDAFYQAVKDYKFEGWAFAGNNARNMHVALKRLIQLRDEKMIGNNCADGQDRNWVHFLGQTRISAGIFFTQMQRVLREQLGEQFTISYDSASSFLAVAKGQIYTSHTFNGPDSNADGRDVPLERQKLNYLMQRGIDDPKMKTQNSKYALDNPFPWKNVVSENLKIRDVCPYMGDEKKTTWDLESYCMLMGYNIVEQINRLQQAQSIIDLPLSTSKCWIPKEVLQVNDIIEEVLTSKTPQKALAAYAQKLQSALMEPDEEDIVHVDTFGLNPDVHTPDLKEVEEYQLQKSAFKSVPVGSALDELF